MKRSIAIIMAGVATVAAVAKAEAALIQLRATGIVAEISNDTGCGLDGSVTNGTLFEAVVFYDLDAPDLIPYSPRMGAYDASGRASVGRYSVPMTGRSSFIEVLDNAFPESGDAVTVRMNGAVEGQVRCYPDNVWVTAEAAGFTGEFVLFLDNWTNVFASDSLLVPTFSDWPSRAFTLFLKRGSDENISMHGALSELTVVPRLTIRSASETSGVQLIAAGEIGRSYRLRTATDLPATDWTDMLSFTLTNATTNIVDSAAANYSRRFYQLVSP